MDGARIEAYKEMIRAIIFVLDTKDSCLRLKPNLDDENRDWVVYSDSDWIRDTENRISVTGFIIYLLGAAIHRRSKGQKGVTLTNSEAECLAMSEAVKEICFIFYLLRYGNSSQVAQHGKNLQHWPYAYGRECKFWFQNYTH
jgi:hypothetical protein